MPRSKPKAQRLAPPCTHSARDDDPSTDIYQLHGVASSATIRTMRSTPVRLSPKTTEAAEISVKNPSGTESPAPTGSKDSRPINRTKTQRRIHPAAHQLFGNPKRATSADHSDRAITPDNPILKRKSERRYLSSDNGRPRLSPIYGSSSDTASIGLAEDIPLAERPGGRRYFQSNESRNAHHEKIKPNAKPLSSAQVSRNLFKCPAPFQSMFSDSATTGKNVEADPSRDLMSLAVCERPSRAQRNTLASVERPNCSFLLEHEAKAVFENEFGNLNVSRNGIERHKLQNYWKEVETVSIRGPRQSEQVPPKIRGSRKNPLANDPPCLRKVIRKPSSVKKSTYKAHQFKHRDVRNLSKEPEKSGGLHPITEESLDGSDAIPFNRGRKKKSSKKVKAVGNTLGYSNDKQIQVRPIENQAIDDAKRKKSSARPSRVNGSHSYAEVAENRLAPVNVMRAMRRRGVPSQNCDDTASSTGLSESDGQACMQCGSHGKASKMVLCDACSEGCHTFCMRPARRSIPLGVWICPRCHSLARKHEIHLSQLGVFLEIHGFQCEKGCTK